MARGHSILEDLMDEYGVRIPESATRADVAEALSELLEALEGERIPASEREAGPDD
jgi:hypothetical protein